MSKTDSPPRCPICGGRMEPGTITHPMLSGGRVFLFERVPAWVCGQCGDSALSGAVVSEIERILAEQPAPTRLDTVRVYDLAGGRHETPATASYGRE